MSSIKLIRHPVAALVVFAMFISIYVGIYSGFQESYGFTEGDLQDNGKGVQMNLMERLKSMNLIEGIAQLKAGILDLSPPAGSSADILGGLASVGIGALKSVVGVVTIPFEIVGIITEYYTEVPSVIVEICMIIVVYVGFILLSAYLNRDV